MNWKNEEMGYLKSNFPYLDAAFLSKHLSRSSNAIRIKASRLNLRKFSTIHRETLELNKEEEQVILGGLLGDLHCRKTKTSKNARLEGGHCLRQKDYLLYKNNLLKKLKSNLRFLKNVQKTKNGGFFWQSKNYSCLNKYCELFYPNNKKQINRSILDKIDKLGLLIWYLDDGSYNKKNKNSSLYTNNFSYKEQLIIKKWFEEKWKIFPVIYKSKGKGKYKGKIWHYLSFPVAETVKLQSLFQEFDIPECMKYKLPLINHSHTTPISGAQEAHN